MDWFLVFLYNLRIPVALLSAVGITICVVIGLHALKLRSHTKFADPENTDARWRTMATSQVAIILAIVAAIVWAIPSPDYDVRYVDRPTTVIKRVPVKVFSGTKTVYQPSTYQNVFDKCVDHYDYHTDKDVLSQCHTQAKEAVEASMPKPKIILRTVTKYNSYKELYESCIGDWSITDSDKAVNMSPAMIRNQRIQICVDAALKGSKAH